MYQKWSYCVNCLLSGAIVRIGGAQKRADGVAGAKYSVGLFVLGTSTVTARSVPVHQLSNRIVGDSFRKWIG